MMMENDQSDTIRQAVEVAYAQAQPLVIVGGKTKAFYGCHSQGDELDVSQNQGIIQYESTELVVTVRGGTRLAELERLLAEQQQMLAFEPPYFGEQATVAGMVASGLSGPSRPFKGSVRDYVLGVKIINGQGHIMTFGGQVMKNVAGYDVSRLMVGALGTLGVLLEISLKVIPIPAKVLTLVQACEPLVAYENLKTWQRRALPLSAACYDGERWWVRLSGAVSAVDVAAQAMGGEVVENSQFWCELNEQQHSFFTDSKPLWRVSVPPATVVNEGDLGPVLVDWGGAQWWLKSEAAPEKIWEWAVGMNGHATLFNGHDTARATAVFQPLAPPMLALHQRVKQALDPKTILNPARMYKDL